MKTKQTIKCLSCGEFSEVTVRKAFVEPMNQDPKTKFMVRMYQPIEVTKCKKCGKTVAEPNVLIRITNDTVDFWKIK